MAKILKILTEELLEMARRTRTLEMALEEQALEIGLLKKKLSELENK